MRGVFGGPRLLDRQSRSRMRKALGVGGHHGKTELGDFDCHILSALQLVFDVTASTAISGTANRRLGSHFGAGRNQGLVAWRPSMIFSQSAKARLLGSNQHSDETRPRTAGLAPQLDATSQA